MRLTGPSRPLRSRVGRGIHHTSAHQPRALHLMWSALVGWSAHPPVDYGPAGNRRPEPRSGIRRRSIATGSRGEAALDGRTSVALPPIPAAEPAPATTDFGEHNEQSTELIAPTTQPEPRNHHVTEVLGCPSRTS
jgi:hypothetical protein